MKTRPPGEGGVYVVPCQGCDSVYIGQTGRTLEQRLKEHKYFVSKGDQNKAVYRHIAATDHPPDWSNSRMVYRSSDLKKRLVVESALIRKINNFNIMGGTVSVDSSTADLILSCNRSIIENL